MSDIEIARFDGYDEAERDELLSELLATAGEGFQPDTPEKAAWLTSRIAYHEAEAKRIKDAMTRETRRHENAAEGLRQHFGQMLEAFARQAIDAEGGKRQKLVLPNGVALAFRKIPDGLAVVNDAAVLEWAEQECAAAIKRSLSKTPVTAHWKETGEIPPGCEALRDRVGFYIQT